MFIQQLSVFIENREGRLQRVAEVLKENGINMMSLSLADSSEYGLMRMIVSDPQKAKDVLRDNGFSAMLTDVVAVQFPHKVGELADLLSVLAAADLNIEYMYALTTGGNNASMVIKTSDGQKAIEVLQAAGLELYGLEIAYSTGE